MTVVSLCVTALLVSADEAVLRDLKHLLLEAKQKVPEFLLQVESDWDFISRGGEWWEECDDVEVWCEVRVVVR